MNKKDIENLEKFKVKCYNWALSIGFYESELNDFYSFLNSETFLNQLQSELNKASTQEEYNQNITAIVFHQLKELYAKLDNENKLNRILIDNNIIPNL